jgi:thiol-disulfide isomerase/thioredoxin
MKIISVFKYLLLVSMLLINTYKSIGQAITKKIERKSQDSQPVKATKDLEYAFKSPINRSVRISDFKGKFVFVDLWFTGCGACIMANDALKAVHDSLKNENIVFLSISIDKNKKKWIQSITKNAQSTELNNWAGKYYPAEGTVTLYTGGSGSENEFIRKYVPSGFFPQLLLINPSGKILSANPPRPDPNPKILIDYIRGFL